MSRTLLIIDVQTGFRSAGDATMQKNICDEIRRAKKRKAAIIVLEYEGFGPTYLPIQQAIGDYQRFAVAQKGEDDGSEPVLQTALQRRFNRSRWRVCGVNIAYCVNKTVKGLRARIPNTDIEVKQDACNCRYGVQKGWRKFDRANGQAVKRI